MQWLSQYTAKIESELKGFDLPESPLNLYDPLRYFLQIGGKRIRPVLTLLGAELSGKGSDTALPQAIGIELFHNFTLIHDDIMDEAPLRRNKKTLHKKYGINTAILSGDVLLIKAYQQICKTDTHYLEEILELFNATAIEVCEGQQLDMDFETRMDVSVADYIEMIRLKTSVLLGCALKVGALATGANKSDADALYNFGVNIGIAFQIRDDILDLYADTEQFGKQVGGDIIANKKTILYLTAIGQATKEQREIIMQLQNETDLVLKIERMAEVFDVLNVKSLCEERMRFYFEHAMNSLESVEASVENKSKLQELAAYLIEREF